VTIDVERARELTPGCERVVHLNNAGAALSPEPVLDAVIGHLRREAEIGGYEAADEASATIASIYESVATMLGCDSDEVALVESATTAWDGAFFAFAWQRGDRILTGRSEYGSNVVAMLHLEKRLGVVIDVVDDDEHGQISVDALRDRIDDDVKLIALTHVPTSGGLVNPAAEVGAVAREAGVPLLLDACQSVGQLPIDVRTIGCDMLSATGRKFLRGPRGTGFLYVRRELAETLVPHVLDSRAATWTSPHEYVIEPAARRFETWEHSVATRVGLGVAVEHALTWGLDEIAGRNAELAARLRAALAEVPRVTVRDKGLHTSAIVTFTVDGAASADIGARLRARGINTSVATPAFAQFDMAPRGLTDMVRASVHYYNTDAEVDRLVDEVRVIAAT
jgi:selenocysteine lyase/cysteine desulfurase